VARLICGDHLRSDVEVGTELLDNYVRSAEVKEKSFSFALCLIFSLVLLFFFYHLFLHQLTYLTEDNWSSMIAGYRAQCEGQSLGIVSSYEKGKAAEATTEEL
jgi:hypothetical protein